MHQISYISGGFISIITAHVNFKNISEFSQSFADHDGPLYRYNAKDQGQLGIFKRRTMWVVAYMRFHYHLELLEIR